MNKKGFTLIELMCVIVILFVIAVITTPIIIDVISNVRNELSEQQKQIIINAARTWGVKNLSVDDNNNPIYDSNVKNSITIDELRNAGFLDKKELKSLKLNEEELDTAGVCISYDNKYVYVFTKNVEECGS